jgi:hypothetical protein
VELSVAPSTRWHRIIDDEHERDDLAERRLRVRLDA